MKNPTVPGVYWVWRLPKDVDRGVCEMLAWDVVYRCWRERANPSWAYGGEFAAWSGPVETPLPPESLEEVAAEYKHGRAGIVLANPDVFPLPKSEDGLEHDQMPRYECGSCGQLVGVVHLEELPCEGRGRPLIRAGGPWRFCPGCGARLGDKPPDPKPTAG